jgi:broad specificity phosphatase PhoE
VKGKMHLHREGARTPIVVLIAALILSGPSTLFAQKKAQSGEPGTAPRYILIIRHAEKPAEKDPSPDLSPAGIARARVLAGLFTASATRPNPFPKPDYIFAASTTKRSRRPLATAAPLGAALGLNVDTRFRNEAVAALARELLERRKYAGKTVLVVWHHGSIPELARALRAKDAPRSWKDSTFDRVWVITYDASGHATFQDRPQQLVIGDSPT